MYPQQGAVAGRLAMAGKKMLRDRVELPARDMIVGRWRDVKDDLRARARDAWTNQGAHGGPAFAEAAKHRIIADMDRTLRSFRGEAAHLLTVAKQQAYDQQYLQACWILDQTTPPNVTVRPRKDHVARYWNNRKARPLGRRRAREAWFTDPIEGGTTADGEPSHDARIDGWFKAWQAAAVGGLVLSGVQGDTAEDMADRMDAARAGGFDIEDVLSRLISTEVQVSIADADDAVDQENGTLIEDRIWQTMDDEHVCDECEAQAGQSRDDTDADIPLHPVCRCWWRIVPRLYQELAGDLAAAGVGPRSMAFKDPATGKTAGWVVVTFDTWAQSLS